MIDFLNRYARNVHSQNGEDGIVAECLRRMNHLPSVGHVVEIGANDGHWMSNSRFRIEWGWSATLVESDWNLYRACVDNWKDYPFVRVQCCHVDGNNVNTFVDDRCDLFSTDTDGGDYRIFCGLQAKPKIVIVEIDSSFPPDKEGFNSDGGAGYFSMMVAALERGYFLLAHTGNLVLVREEYKELFPEVEGHPILDSERYFNRAWIREAA